MVLVRRSSPLFSTALPPVFFGPPFWAVLFLPSLFRSCRRRASSVWTPTALSSCGSRRRVVGDVPLCFCGAELSAENNPSFPRCCGGWPTRRASSLSFSVVRLSPSSFRGSLRLVELGETVLCRVEHSCRWVGDLAGVYIRQHRSSSEHFSYRSSSCHFSLVVVALFPVVLSVFCFRSCPFARLFLPVLARSFLGCGCRSISSYYPVVDLSVFCFRSCPFALVLFCFGFVEKCWLYTTLAKKIETIARRWDTGECSLEHARASSFACVPVSIFFFARVSRSTNVNPGNRQADRGCTSRRCDQ